MFTEINGTCLIRLKTGYRELKLFELNNEIYAKNGNTFIKLRSDKGTSNPAIDWVDVFGVDYCFVRSIMNIRK